MKIPLYIVWNNENNFGIPIIDEQHRGIVTTLNSLHYFVTLGHGEEVIKPTLLMLEQYTAIHFKTEEQLLLDSQYPDYENHIVFHRNLVMETQKVALDAETYNDPSMLLNFLKKWWLDHINREDRKYVPYVKEAK